MNIICCNPTRLYALLINIAVGHRGHACLVVLSSSPSYTEPYAVLWLKSPASHHRGSLLIWGAHSPWLTAWHAEGIRKKECGGEGRTAGTTNTYTLSHIHRYTSVLGRVNKIAHISSLFQAKIKGSCACSVALFMLLLSSQLIEVLQLRSWMRLEPRQNTLQLRGETLEMWGATRVSTHNES